MTIFELVKIALDELYEECIEQYGADVDNAIKDQMEYLSSNYGELRKKHRAPIDYKDPATRFAYVYKYVACHGDYIVQVLEALRSELEGPIFSSESIRVTCVGGGPGSDIIAVLKYLDERGKSEKVEKVVCYLLDREQAWADTWTELDDSLETDLKLHANFQPLDVTDPKSWAYQKKFLQADLFTLSYFISEVRSLDGEGIVTEFLDTLFAESKSGALFLYDDNGHDHFTEYFDDIWKAAGLELLVASDSKEITPRYSEEKSELGDFLTKFGQQPKLKTTLAYRVLRKP